MCAVSAVSDYYLNTWPNRFPNNPEPWKTDPEVKETLRRIVELLEKMDSKLKDVECHDEAKEQFLKEIGFES